MKSVQIFTGSVSWLIFVISIVGNATLIVALKHHAHRASRVYIFLMLNLATADIVLVLSAIPFNFIERLYDPDFPFGSGLCKFLMPFQTGVAMTAIFTVVALSCQRYFMIVRPSEDHHQKGNAAIISIIFLCLWFLPILSAALPLAISLELRGGKCEESWSTTSSRCFTVYLTIIQYAAPLTIIAWCNGRAVVELRRHEVYRENYAIINPSILDRHNNVVRMLICIVVVFAIFWFPGQLAWLVLTFSNGGERWKTLLEISELFIFANSALNPLIFFIYNEEYSLGKLSNCFRCKQRSGRMKGLRQTGSATAHMLTTV